MKTLNLIYAGKRSNGKKLVFQYYVIDLNTYITSSSLVFGKLLMFGTIGYMISCEETEKGVKGPYTRLSIDERLWRESKMDYLLTSWSVRETSDKEELKAKKAAMENHPAHIDELIKAAKEHTYSPNERRRIAMYIYNKIIGI